MVAAAPGVELCHAYADLCLPGPTRRTRLREAYGFDCDCARCKGQCRVDVWVEEGGSCGCGGCGGDNSGSGGITGGNSVKKSCGSGSDPPPLWAAPGVGGRWLRGVDLDAALVALNTTAGITAAGTTSPAMDTPTAAAVAAAAAAEAEAEAAASPETSTPQPEAAETVAKDLAATKAAQAQPEAQAKARAQALATADAALGLASSCAVRGDDEGEAAALRRCVALREAWLGPMHGDL